MERRLDTSMIQYIRSIKLQEYELNNEFVILFSVWSNRYIALLSII